MTELLYHTDSYLREFSAKITGVDSEQHGVFLDRTAFYPGGGGQPYDAGQLLADGKTYTVTKAGRGNIHILAEDELPPVGAKVRGILDWDRRYKLMRTHTAMHILCGVVWRDYGASVTGGNMEPLSGRMDFEFERMQKELVAEIEERINVEVAAARDLRVAILPRAEAFQIPDLIRTKINLLPEGIPEVRTVEIIGLDLQADGGTHVANTHEVGRIRITDYKSKGGINKRIYVELEAAPAG
ncbi:MAG: alanyl-tRNA editing protein [Anaerolineaceae bacterium]|nr:alanyl-tRNA editing protein [Anaerolineaceae bacterium]